MNRSGLLLALWGRLGVAIMLIIPLAAAIYWGVTP